LEDEYAERIPGMIMISGCRTAGYGILGGRYVYVLIDNHIGNALQYGGMKNIQQGEN